MVLNAYLLTATILTGIWIVFYILYVPRILGFIFTLLIRKFVIKRSGHVKIKSISFSILSGRFFFSDLQITNLDASITCVDGYITFKWWSSLEKISSITLNTVIKDYKKLFQIRRNAYIYIRGLTMCVFNRHARYEEIFKFFEKPKQKDSDYHTIMLDNTELQPEYKNYFDKMISAVHIRIENANILIGNKLVENSLHLYISALKIYSACIPSGEPLSTTALVTLLGIDKISAFFKPSTMIDTIQKQSRDSSDGVRLLDASDIKILFYTEEDVNTETSPPSVPRFGVDIHIIKNFELTFGPWHNTQRIALQNLFFPTDYQKLDMVVKSVQNTKIVAENLSVNIMIYCASKLKIIQPVNNSTTIKYFDICLSEASTITMAVPFVYTKERIAYFGEIFLANMTIISHLKYGKFLSTGMAHVKWSIEYGLSSTDLQEWICDIGLQKSTINFLPEHLDLLLDLSYMWVGKPQINLSKFYPIKYFFNVTLVDTELVLYANSSNMISSEKEEHNSKIGFACSLIKTNFMFDYTNINPVSVKTDIPIIITGMNMYLFVPENSSLYTLSLKMNELYRENCFSGSSAFLSFINEKTWIKIAMSRVAQIYISYINYPQYIFSCCINESDNFTNAESKDCPINKNSMKIQVIFGQTLFNLYGIFAYYFINGFIGNYFGQKSKVRNPTEETAENHEIDDIAQKSSNSNLCFDFSLCVCELYCNFVQFETFDTSPPTGYSKTVCIEIKSNDKFSSKILFSPMLIRTVSKSGSKEDCGFIFVDGILISMKNLMSDATLDQSPKEYAFFKDILVGKISGFINAEHLKYLMAFLHQFFFGLTCNENDVQEINIYPCYHGYNPSECTTFGPKVTKHGQKLCLTLDELQYKRTYLNINDIAMFVRLTDSLAIYSEVQKINLSSCTAHSVSCIPGFSFSHDKFSVRFYHSTTQPGFEWLELASFEIDNIILVYSDNSFKEDFANLHRDFIKKCDSSNKYFAQISRQNSEESQNYEYLFMCPRCSIQNYLGYININYCDSQTVKSFSDNELHRSILIRNATEFREKFLAYSTSITNEPRGSLIKPDAIYSIINEEDAEKSPKITSKTDISENDERDQAKQEDLADILTTKPSEKLHYTDSIITDFMSSITPSKSSLAYHDGINDAEFLYRSQKIKAGMYTIKTIAHKSLDDLGYIIDVSQNHDQINNKYSCSRKKPSEAYADSYREYQNFSTSNHSFLVRFGSIRSVIHNETLFHADGLFGTISNLLDKINPLTILSSTHQMRESHACDVISCNVSRQKRSSWDYDFFSYIYVLAFFRDIQFYLVSCLPRTDEKFSSDHCLSDSVNVIFICAEAQFMNFYTQTDSLNIKNVLDGLSGSQNLDEIIKSYSLESRLDSISVSLYELNDADTTISTNSKIYDLIVENESTTKPLPCVSIMFNALHLNISYSNTYNSIMVKKNANTIDEEHEANNITLKAKSSIPKDMKPQAKFYDKINSLELEEKTLLTLKIADILVNIRCIEGKDSHNDSINQLNHLLCHLYVWENLMSNLSNRIEAFLNQSNLIYLKTINKALEDFKSKTGDFNLSLFDRAQFKKLSDDLIFDPSLLLLHILENSVDLKIARNDSKNLNILHENVENIIPAIFNVDCNKLKQRQYKNLNEIMSNSSNKNDRSSKKVDQFDEGSHSIDNNLKYLIIKNLLIPLGLWNQVFCTVKKQKSNLSIFRLKMELQIDNDNNLIETSQALFNVQGIDNYSGISSLHNPNTGTYFYKNNISRIDLVDIVFPETVSNFILFKISSILEKFKNLQNMFPDIYNQSRPIGDASVQQENKISTRDFGSKIIKEKHEVTMYIKTTVARVAMCGFSSTLTNKTFVMNYSKEPLGNSNEKYLNFSEQIPQSLLISFIESNFTFGSKDMDLLKIKMQNGSILLCGVTKLQKRHLINLNEIIIHICKNMETTLLESLKIYEKASEYLNKFQSDSEEAPKCSQSDETDMVGVYLSSKTTASFSVMPSLGFVYKNSGLKLIVNSRSKLLAVFQVESQAVHLGFIELKFQHILEFPRVKCYIEHFSNQEIVTINLRVQVNKLNYALGPHSLRGILMAREKILSDTALLIQNVVEQLEEIRKYSFVTPTPNPIIEVSVTVCFDELGLFLYSFTKKLIIFQGTDTKIYFTNKKKLSSKDETTQYNISTHSCSSSTFSMYLGIYSDEFLKFCRVVSSSLINLSVDECFENKLMFVKCMIDWSFETHDISALKSYNSFVCTFNDLSCYFKYGTIKEVILIYVYVKSLISYLHEIFKTIYDDKNLTMILSRIKEYFGHQIQTEKTKYLSIKLLVNNLKISTPLYLIGKMSSTVSSSPQSHICFFVQSCEMSMNTRKNRVKGSMSKTTVQFLTKKENLFPKLCDYWKWNFKNSGINYFYIESGSYEVIATTNVQSDRGNVWNVIAQFDVSDFETRIDSNIGNQVHLLIDNIKSSQNFPPTDTMQPIEKEHVIRQQSLSQVEEAEADLVNDFVRYNTPDELIPTIDEIDSRVTQINPKEQNFNRRFLKNLKRQISHSFDGFDFKPIHHYLYSSQEKPTKSPLGLKSDSTISSQFEESQHDPNELCFIVKSYIRIKNGKIIIFYPVETKSTKHKRNLSDVNLMSSADSTLGDSQEELSLKLPLPDISLELSYTSAEGIDPQKSVDEASSLFVTKLIVYEIPSTYELNPKIVTFFAALITNFSKYDTMSVKSDQFTDEDEETSTSSISSEVKKSSNILGIFYVVVASSTIRFTCLPNSKINGSFNIPGLNAMCSFNNFSSSRLHEFASLGLDTNNFVLIENPSNWCLWVSITLTDFLFELSHPYLAKEGPSKTVTSESPHASCIIPEMDQTTFSTKFTERLNSNVSGNILLFNITSIDFQLTRYTYLEEITDPSPSLEVTKRKLIHANTKTSVICHLGSSAFHFNTKYVNDIRSAIDSWVYQGLLFKIFMGKNAARSTSNQEATEVQKSVDNFNTWSSQIIVSIKFDKLVLSAKTGYTLGRIIITQDIQTLNLSIRASHNEDLVIKYLYKSSGISFSLISGIVGGSVNVGNVEMIVTKNTLSSKPFCDIDFKASHIDLKLEHMSSVYFMASINLLRIRYTDLCTLFLHSTTQTLARGIDSVARISWKSASFIGTQTMITNMKASVDKLLRFYKTNKEFGLKTLGSLRLKSPSHNYVNFERFAILQRPEKVLVSQDSSKDSENTVVWQDTKHNISEEDEMEKRLSSDNEFDWIVHIYNMVKFATSLSKNREYSSSASSNFIPLVKFEFIIDGNFASLCIFNGPHFRASCWGLIIVERFTTKLTENYNFSLENPFDINQQKLYNYDQIFNSSIGKSTHEGKSNDLDVCALVLKVVRDHKSAITSADSVLSWIKYVHSFKTDSNDCIRLVANMQESISRSTEVTKSPFSTTRIPNHSSSMIFSILPTDINATYTHYVSSDPMRQELCVHKIICSFLTHFSGHITSTTDLNHLLFLKELFQSFLVEDSKSETPPSSSRPQSLLHGQRKSLKKMFRKFYEVNEYSLQPRIKLFNWATTNLKPIDIEWILTNLGFTDPASTIPPAFHEYFLGHMDKITNIFCRCLVKNYKNFYA